MYLPQLKTDDPANLRDFVRVCERVCARTRFYLHVCVGMHVCVNACVGMYSKAQELQHCAEARWPYQRPSFFGHILNNAVQV